MSAVPPRVCVDLATLRRLRGMSQAQVAAAMGKDQSRVSRIERGEDPPLLGTLRRYVEALGGRLELHAVFDGQDILIET